MKTHFLVPALCVVLMPLMAFAGDYKRKDYLESYERNYERTGNVVRAPSQKSVKTDDAPPRSTSYDEYSLYEWSEQKQSSTGTNEKPGMFDEVLSFLESLPEPKHDENADLRETIADMERREQHREMMGAYDIKRHEPGPVYQKRYPSRVDEVLSRSSQLPQTNYKRESAVAKTTPFVYHSLSD